MTGTRTSKGWIGGTLIALVALVWAGMVIGVSGLATPVKFTAPSLTFPHALEVGRVTFQLFSRVEWALTIMLALTALAARTTRSLWLAIGFVAALILAQAVWLLPALDARTIAVIAGGQLASGPLHAWYIAAEAVKVVALLFIGTMVMRDGLLASRPG